MPSDGRPKLVTVVSLGVLTLSALSLARFVLGLTPSEFPLTVPGWYPPLTGLVWGSLSLLAAVGLFLGRPWALATTGWGAIAYCLWFWADRLLLAQSDFAARSRPASLVLTVLGLAALWWALRRPSLRRYYREKTE